ncbi:aluminum-activated malate transporter 4 isoform X2 [Physcomitrium patens]|uniref:Uncharacterized protein n=1 Tax=Physcomitrium patens TaxID=3218 RepID=A0A2K1KH63_PHYPA|nr:aluminum-activated malate transporter 4-like isoform X2 [Physcomitrium patens]PNR53099.1 hypothetical protein PHYPA_009474 [Physcomitrium patens]|eukprot:XP_024379269.1 aluminum-activated malate transporter 4-like isoform X2 [Physcomitrella patens]
MYQHDTNTEGISQSLPDPQAPPENLRSIETESIEVKVEPILTRVNSIEGGARRIATQEKLKQKVRRIRHYLKIHKDEQWHGFKIALAVLLSSTPVLVGPLYDYFGMNSLWLIISVIIIYEPTVGSFLSKGILRMIGTVSAILVALACSEMTEISGRAEVYLIPVFLFMGSWLLGFIRQVPPVKEKYDYAALTGFATFGFLTLSEYRTHEGPRLAGLRMLLILVGFAISFGANIGIKPNFAGNELHKVVAAHFDKIALALETCVQAYVAGSRMADFERILEGPEPEDVVYEGYKTVILAKENESALHELVVYEPPHGHFELKYPWDLYKDVSRQCRHCMYIVLAMDGCLRSEIQCPVNIRQLLSRPMTRLAGEAIKVLEAMGECVSEMKMVNLRPYITAVDAAALDLQKELQEKATLLITPTPETDRWVESFLDEDDERARASMSSSKARRSAAAELTEGKRASTEDDESVEFSFPIMQVEEVLDEGYLHTDSYGHQSRVTPGRSLGNTGLLQSTSSDLQERHRYSAELTDMEPLPPASGQGSLTDRINRKPSSRQLMVPVPGGIAVFSLVQFVCSLVEFVAKLNLLVNCVNTLSEKAGFTCDGRIWSSRESAERRTRLETVTNNL